MDVDEAATELYALPLDQFVAARDAAAKQIKREGAADAAAQLRALRKPTVAAWLVNQLVRVHRAEIDELVALGDEMRNATAAQDGARLRELTPRRKELVDTLLRHARKLATEAGQRVSQDALDAVSETLLAATADPGVASELQRGCLTHSLQHVGFGPAGEGGDAAQVISLSQARAARGQGGGGTSAGQRLAGKPARRADRDEADPDDEQGDDGQGQLEAERRDARERAEAEHELELAESAVAEAEERVGDLSAHLEERRRAVEGAEATVARLSAELEAARRELDQVRDEVQGAEDEFDEAQAEAERARQHRRAAKRRLG